MMLRNLAAVAPNYRDAGIGVFVVAYFIRDLDALHSVRETLEVPLRVVRLSVSLQDIERRLALDATSGRAMICAMRRHRSPQMKVSESRT